MVCPPSTRPLGVMRVDEALEIIGRFLAEIGTVHADVEHLRPHTAASLEQAIQLLRGVDRDLRLDLMRERLQTGQITHDSPSAPDL